MFKYKIERNVPVPDKRYMKNKYPFSEMRSGDSFGVNVDPNTPLNYIQTSARICAALSAYCNGSYSRWFMTITDKKKEEVRVFCVADGHKDWKRSLK